MENGEGQETHGRGADHKEKTKPVSKFDKLFLPKTFIKDINTNINTQILWGMGIRRLLTQCWECITAVIE